MRIALLLSGGVDSSVALELLRRQGHQLEAFYLKIWLEEELSFLGECPWEDDLGYAREVCQAAGVPLTIVPLQQEYQQEVVRWALLELQAGRTPSPDLWCNERIKFGAFLDHIDSPSFDKIASGHYARLRETTEGTQLLQAKDPVKDQTYFLSRLRPEQLKRCLFPIGEYLKSEVRALAEEFRLANRQRKDSQGICFLGKIAYDDFVASYLGEAPGDIRDLDSGRILGQHRGYWFHTIGQRKGLGLGGGPWYVVRKDVASNTLHVAHREQHHQHRQDHFLIPEPHWILHPPTAGQALEVKLRHSPTTCRCELSLEGETGLAVQLAEEDPGVAPGQSAVFYQGEVCLGGGVIETAPQELAGSP